MTLCFIDTEATGLDPRIHMPWEVCWWREDDEEAPTTILLPHTLDRADPVALDIGRYHEREIEPGWFDRDRWTNVAVLSLQLAGVTLVGSNPGFDAGMLAPLLRCEPWNHRMIDVGAAAMWVFGWDLPRGLAGAADACRAEGFDIPVPDHSAEGDVRTTRAVFYALRMIRDARLS